MSQTDLVEQARLFAIAAHRGQTRKFTAEPYINHPLAVWALVCSVPHTVEMECAALLHDTVEDTGVALAEIERCFGTTVACYVAALTDTTGPADGDRARRKLLVKSQLAAAPVEAKTVKLADIIDNLSSVAERDPAFARGYMAEKRAVLPALHDGDACLLARVEAILAAYFDTASTPTSSPDV
jgi:(p)ppGpp synthase/HD superfamily hydrolase